MIPDPVERTDPTISVVIPMRNESATIETCLDSVLASRLPPGESLEILVLDGASDDNSAAKVAAIAARDPRVRLLPNPERLQAAAFNRGLEAARGKYLVRMDAHSLYADDYIAESIRLLEETGAENVGGVQRASGDSWVSRAIAAAVSSRFAAGDAKYRNATTPAFTDTVYLGAWRTETLRRLGGMRTDWAVNEDYEMNVRLRAAGGRVYLSPTIRSTYFARGSLPKLARQYARYGFWKVRTLREHPGSLRWRQLVAPTFVLSLLMTPLLLHWLGPLGAGHLVLYLAASLATSAALARRQGWSLLPLLPVVFLIIHLAWGFGFLAGLWSWPFRSDEGGLTRWGERLAWITLAGLGFIWLCLAGLGDRIWWTLPILYGPRWLYALGMIGFVPGLLLAPRRTLLPATAGLLMALFGLLDVHLGLGRFTLATGTPFRVMELNAGAGSGGIPKASRILEAVRSYHPDVVVIAECGGGLPDSLHVVTDYHVKLAITSLCLMSKEPILDWEERDPMDIWKEGGAGAIVRAVVASPAGPIRVGMVHLETPRGALDEFGDLSAIPSLGPITNQNIHQREEESRDARSYIFRGPDLPTIVAGDFNLPVESALYRRYWGGFRNAFSRTGLGTGYTKHTRWWGVRIDHILSDETITPTKSFVGVDVGSDHRPVIADLLLPGGQRTRTAR